MGAACAGAQALGTGPGRGCGTGSGQDLRSARQGCASRAGTWAEPGGHTATPPSCPQPCGRCSAHGALELRAGRRRLQRGLGSEGPRARLCARPQTSKWHETKHQGGKRLAFILLPRRYFYFAGRARGPCW